MEISRYTSQETVNKSQENKATQEGMLAELGLVEQQLDAINSRISMTPFDELADTDKAYIKNLMGMKPGLLLKLEELKKAIQEYK